VKERIQKVLSHAGVASRREGERLLAAGRIRVNGVVVMEPGTKVDADDRIEVDGNLVRLDREPRYLLMYKPRGCVTTLSDPEGRPTVMAHLPTAGPRVFPVGRLDYDTEGLLLFTNDGDLAQALMRPRQGVAKVYQAKVQGLLEPATLARLRRPFRLDGRPTRPARVEVLYQRRHTVLQITLTEGRRNQVRELCRRVGHPVMRLRRVAYGPLYDPSLRPGQTRPLQPAEVMALRQAAGAGVEAAS
jgi:pseudouridine synthase